MPKIVINDPLYGDIKVTDLILIELINSRSIQRLKQLNQFGVPNQYYFKVNFSRFDHSIGVMHLIAKFGGNQKEQVAGLLHDVSHRAFSHLADWALLENAIAEDLQDNSHQSFITQSEIPTILDKHQLSSDQIIDYHHFSLLEQPTPDLCADRVDYALRELPIATAQQILSGLTVKQQQIVCQDHQTAKLFAESFLYLQQTHWGSFQGSSRYYHLAECLKLALAEQIIDQEDFWTDDQTVVDKLIASHHPIILKTLNYFSQGILPSVKKGIRVYKKFRHIDPLFIDQKSLSRLSEVDENFKQSLIKARTLNQKGVLIANFPIS